MGIANVTPTSACNAGWKGYNSGFTAVQQVTDTTVFTYDSTDFGLLFGSQGSGCYGGLLLFQQGSQYGVLKFTDFDASGTVYLEYWLGDPGITNFTNAP